MSRSQPSERPEKDAADSLPFLGRCDVPLTELLGTRLQRQRDRCSSLITMAPISSAAQRVLLDPRRMRLTKPVPGRALLRIENRRNFCVRFG